MAAPRRESPLGPVLAPWYRENGRHDLPWRQTRDRYAVLISEVMLQQTQVERVVPYWQAWMARWPDVVSLAAADPAEVIRAWAGLGYNRRAVSLVRAAQSVVERFGGEIPGDPAPLRTLPGVGRYTANAVACFADGRRVPVVDTNVGRVVARAVLGVPSGRAMTTKAIEAAIDAVLPARGARERSLALMDMGALVCRVRQPACDGCPLRNACAWRAAGYPAGEAGKVKPAAKFGETARYARGRIVDWLRARDTSAEAEIAAALPEAHRTRVAEYLAALERDGLVARAGDGLWGLAGTAQGRMSMASPKL